MSTHRKVYATFLLTATLAVCGALVSPPAFCADNPPIPPQRPKVMQVSPEYIEKLRNRGQQDQITLDETAELEQEKASADAELEQEMLKTTKEEVLAVLDGKTSPSLIPKDSSPSKENVSLPSAPPAPVEEVRLSEETPLPQDIAPAASAPAEQKNLAKPKIAALGTELSHNIPVPAEKPALPEERQTTLISFALPPEKIQLDQQIVSFLEEHALPMLGKDESMTLEINAYAKPMQGEESGAMRVALARALEVRRFLMDHNISPSRLKLNHADNNAPQDDRIDLVLVR